MKSLPRRSTLTWLAAGALPRRLQAQDRPPSAPAPTSRPAVGRVLRLGFLFEADQRFGAVTEQIIRDELAALSRASGRPAELLARYAEHDPSRIPKLAQELAFGPQPVAAIITNGLAAMAVLGAVAGVPVVVIGMSDRVLTPAHAQGHRARLTGIRLMTDELDVKRVELLARCLPPGSLIVNLASPRKRDWPQTDAFVRMGAALGMRLQVAYAGSAAEITQAIEQAARSGAAAINQMADQILYAQRRLIADTALALRLPTMMEWPEAVRDGATMGYGVHRPLVFRRLTQMAWRAALGEPPESIPIEQPTQVTLALHLRRAQQIGFALPADVMARAEEMIE